MATQEALIKYYDCLKDSFSKIQEKDNNTALINAALRPKIREELTKNKDVLVSYLNYIQIFTPIYPDKFSNICFGIICPIYKECSPIHRFDDDNHENVKEESDETANLIHKTMKEILKSDPELVEEYIHCLVKFFPNPYNDDNQTFTKYLDNLLEVCTYIKGESLTILLSRILDKINPPASKDQNDDIKLAQREKSLKDAYEMIYGRLEILEKRQLENVSAAILAAFSRGFLMSENGDSLNYLVFYVCSLDSKLTDLFINLLWAIFTNPNRPIEERRTSVYYASSFMSRALYVDLAKVLNYLENAVVWCNDVISVNKTDNDNNDDTPSRSNKSSQLFFSLVDSIMYLLTQRYRELYEKESIERIQLLDLDKIFKSDLKPLEVCDTDTVRKFRELAALYGISNLGPLDESSYSRKKCKYEASLKSRELPFKESNSAVPDRLKDLYRTYYNHRNFTVYRE